MSELRAAYLYFYESLFALKNLMYTLAEHNEAIKIPKLFKLERTEKKMYNETQFPSSQRVKWNFQRAKWSPFSSTLGQFHLMSSFRCKFAFSVICSVRWPNEPRSFYRANFMCRRYKMLLCSLANTCGVTESEFTRTSHIHRGARSLSQTGSGGGAVVLPVVNDVCGFVFGGLCQLTQPNARAWCPT